MNPEYSKQQLAELVEKFKDDVVDNTQLIRKVRRSDRLESEVERMRQLMVSLADLKVDNPTSYENRLKQECWFLFEEYTPIFQKLLEGALDKYIFDEFITELRKIESGATNQHESSVNVGALLRRLFIDPQLEQEERRKKREKNYLEPHRDVSYRDYFESQRRLRELKARRDAKRQ